MSKKGNGGIPPMDDLFKQARVLQMERPKTLHQETIIFQGCVAGFFPVFDENNICTHYTLRIEDAGESKIYSLPFQEEVKDDFIKSLSEMPAVGERVTEPNG